MTPGDKLNAGSRTTIGGVMLLMAIESACIPLPSEIIMPFSGALTIPSIAAQYGREPFTLLLVAFFGAVGCNVGSVLVDGRFWTPATALGAV